MEICSNRLGSRGWPPVLKHILGSGKNIPTIRKVLVVLPSKGPLFPGPNLAAALLGACAWLQVQLLGCNVMSHTCWQLASFGACAGVADVRKRFRILCTEMILANIFLDKG